MELEQQRALRQLEELAAEVGLTSRLASRASNEPSQSLKLNNHNPLLVEKKPTTSFTSHLRCYQDSINVKRLLTHGK